MSVYKKLNEAREQFHASKIKKTGLNKFAGYEYFELSDFIVPALQIFKACGLSGVVSFGKELATLTVVDVDKPDDRIEFVSPMSEANLKGCHPVQNLGAVQSYIRRYLWVAALEIVEHDALDATTGKDGPKKVIITPTAGAQDEITPEEMQILQKLAIEVIALCGKGKPGDALSAMRKQNLTNEQKTALWTLLPSNVRSAIKTAEKTPL